MRSIRKAASRALSWLLVAAITMGALEVVCRLVDPIGISYYPETARWLDTLVVDEHVGYWNRPGTEGTFFGADVRINSRGLRGPEIPEKVPGEFRVLLMGDSFPFGIGVREDQAFPALLERLLDRGASAGTDYRVINMGVVSYNTVQELRQLRELGLSLQPDAVVLAFAVNDIEPEMWVLDKRRGRLANAVQRSYAASLLAIVARNVKHRLFGFTGIALHEFREDSARWQTVDRSLSEMNALCRQAGIPFVVFTYDEKLQSLMTLLHRVGARERFPVLNVFPSQHPVWGARDPRTLVNSAVDSHPNVEGNVMWAELLAEALPEHLDTHRRRP